MKYSLKFSWRGLLIVLLPMLPNILYFWLPSVISPNTKIIEHIGLKIVEHGCRIIFMILLILFTSKESIQKKKTYKFAMTIFLMVYYILWIMLFMGELNSLIIICLAIFPVLYFLVSELWLRIYISILPTIVFGIVHVILTYKEYFPYI